MAPGLKENLIYMFVKDAFVCKYVCIPESFNTNISHHLFGNTNSKGDFVHKDFWYTKINSTQIWYNKFN